MKTFREQYFEDYQAVLKPDGKHVDYVYSGKWCAWCLTGKELAKRKAVYLLLELVSILLFAVSGVQQTAANRYGAVALPAIVSLVPWMVELYAVAMFCFGKRYFTEFDQVLVFYEIILGGTLHGLLISAAGVASMVCACIGNAEPLAWAVGAGFLASALPSLAIAVLQRKTRYRTYQNIGGTVGPEDA